LTHLQQREEHWAIVDLVGKGGHIRTIPVPEWVKATIDLWVAAAGISAGRLFRCVCRAGKHWGDDINRTSSLARRDNSMRGNSGLPK
jgi:hypothetical protein